MSRKKIAALKADIRSSPRYPLWYTVVHSAFKRQAKMEKISLHKFYFDSWTLARNNRWRYGQAMFNNLTIVRPDLAEKVRGTPADPFYVERLDDPRWDRFVKVIEADWYT